MKPVLTLALAALTALIAAQAHADSPSDYLGPRELALGESSRASSIGASATTMNPAGLALTRELVGEAFYGYRSGASDSHLASIAACDSTVPVAGCLYYRYFRDTPAEGASDRRRAHEFGSTVARGFGGRIFVGVTSRYFDYSSRSGNPDDKGFGVDGGLLLRVMDAVSLGVVGHNLVSASSTQYRRSVGAGVTVRPFRAFSLSADGLWRIEGDDDEGSKSRYGGGAEYFISGANGQAGYPLRAGVMRDVTADVTYVSGGLGVVTELLGLDVGARKELDGDGLAILVSLRLFGPRFAPDQRRP